MALKKGKKTHVNKVKRKNKTQNKHASKGKLKIKHHKSLTQSTPLPVHHDQEEEEESDHGAGLLEMVDDDDLAFLKNAISNRSYSMLKHMHYKKNDAKLTHQRKRSRIDDEENIEDNYEKSIPESEVKRMKYLLPIKTKEGLVLRSTEENECGDIQESVTEHTTETEEVDTDDEYVLEEVSNSLDLKEPISTAELLACREEVVQKYKFQIGVLSSGLLENPENKTKNFKILLDMMEEKNADICITVQKLAAVSLLEIFKDLIPSYHIKHSDTPGVKLKKNTLQLQFFEKTLLNSYKTYLQKMEKLTSAVQRRRGQVKVCSKQEMRLAEIAITCLCELLVMNPYFNFSDNLAQMLVSFLDNHLSSIRSTVATCIKTVLREDKKGKISLCIVRCINHLVKSRSHSVQCEVLTVLLALRIKEVNLDKEKEHEIKQKKFMTHKQKLLRMSKKERKRSKKLEELEKELLETKAEENKQTKQHFFTETTKMVFTIYFRMLKCAPSSKLLSIILEGLARFSHCINLNFYQDLVSVLNNMIMRESLGYREQLHCVKTVFAILSGQGDSLNIDSSRFYTHLYRNLLHILAGRNHNDLLIVLHTLKIILIQQRKSISLQRLLAFTKRLCTLSLQLVHNGSLGCLALIRTAIQMNKSVDVLLDTDTSVGDGVYLPELEEPEYCNASNSSLWELTLLQHHYHPTVCKFAQNILLNVPITGHGSLTAELSKQSSEQLYTDFEPAEMAFHPSVPFSKRAQIKLKPYGGIHFRSEEFETYIDQIVTQPKLVSVHLNSNLVKP